MKYPILAILLILILVGVGFFYREKISSLSSKPQIIETRNGNEEELRNIFRDLPIFDDYPVSEIYSGPVSAVDFANNPEAARFEGRLSEAVKNSPNFAGHYILTSWGCGSPCQTGAVINAKNGKVIPLPQSSYGYGYRKDSGLLVVDPPDKVFDILDLETCPATWIGTDYYLLTDGKFDLIQRVSCSDFTQKNN